MKQRLLQVGLIFLLSLLFVSFSWAEEVTITPDDKTREILRIDTDQEFVFKWISFQGNNEEIAYVNGKCEIVKKRKVGHHIQAELSRYKGICEDMKAIGNEGR